MGTYVYSCVYNMKNFPASEPLFKDDNFYYLCKKESDRKWKSCSWAVQTKCNSLEPASEVQREDPCEGNPQCTLVSQHYVDDSSSSIREEATVIGILATMVM